MQVESTVTFEDFNEMSACELFEYLKVLHFPAEDIKELQSKFFLFVFSTGRVVFVILSSC